MDDIFKGDLVFEWDEGNREKNWKSHLVSYKEAEEVFEDIYSYTSEDVKHSQVEKRYQILGLTEINNKFS